MLKVNGMLPVLLIMKSVRLPVVLTYTLSDRVDGATAQVSLSGTVMLTVIFFQHCSSEHVVPVALTKT